jgi:hypothetical protein
MRHGLDIGDKLDQRFIQVLRIAVPLAGEFRQQTGIAARPRHEVTGAILEVKANHMGHVAGDIDVSDGLGMRDGVPVDHRGKGQWVSCHRSVFLSAGTAGTGTMQHAPSFSSHQLTCAREKNGQRHS